jgi:hypothetical protein
MPDPSPEPAGRADPGGPGMNWVAWILVLLAVIFAVAYGLGLPR